MPQTFPQSQHMKLLEGPLSFSPRKNPRMAGPLKRPGRPTKKQGKPTLFRADQQSDWTPQMSIIRGSQRQQKKEKFRQRK
uniref:Uncharacterized protein n=1 Tax=Pyxicephalus adspersus TaxID=30357 RepID=A0AAV3AGW8_PYXAD|nr:TPA: hypothetical protein GDO54_017896 [Pyxicephalus adspersus]